MNIVGIYRASQFSPNMEDSDAAILNAVADRLRKSGHMVTCVHEELLVRADVSAADVVLSMGRLAQTLDLLQEVEAEGVKVINTPLAVRHCERKQFTQILMDEDVPFAPSTILSTINYQLPLKGAGGSFWLKKGEGYAEVAADVVFVPNAEELAEKIDDMRRRGISTLVVSEHLEGDLIKFYGVRGVPFFYWYDASEGHSKFGLEAINGPSHGYRFSEQQLYDICNHAATVMGLDIYGGDCVVNEDGKIQLIDINDWPSFSRCREQAAEMITKLESLRSKV